MKESNRMKKEVLFGLFAATSIALSAHASEALVKCTNSAGKVTYQQGACPSDAKVDVIKGASPTSQLRDSGVWTFSRNADSMTNSVSCTARSPEIPVGTKREYVYLQLVVIATTGEPVVMLANRTSGSIFHHKIQGMGLKVGDAGLLPFASRPTQTTLIMPSGTGNPIVESLLQYPSARVRVRLWPWDETNDSEAFSLQGFKQAYALAKHCKSQL